MARISSCLVIFLVAFSPVWCHDSAGHHDHEHDHQHEAPHLKYTEGRNMRSGDDDDHSHHDHSHEDHHHGHDDHDHDHHHHHHDEPPHLKYTESRNAKAGEEEEIHHHHHGHHDHHHHHGHHDHHHHHGHHDHHGHGDHHHHHHDEPPHLKYTEAKNAEAKAEGKEPDHHHHDHHGHDGHHHHHDEIPQTEAKSGEHDEEDHHHDHDHGHRHVEPPHKQATVGETRSHATVWLQALLSTVLISAAPFFILFFIPLEANTTEQQPLLKVLLAFASGGLLGDAFLHLIPHAISPHDAGGHSHEHSHSHSHSHGGGEDEHDHSAHMAVGLWVLAGLVTFLCVEKFVRHVKGGHGHSHGPPPAASKNGELSSKETKAEDEETDEQLRERKKTDEPAKEKSGDKDSGHSHADHDDIKVAGYLNLAADFTHNFTDGLAIGASYLVSRNLGIITTITILLHEVPHEIGDFAILVQSGCSKRKAMFLQLTTATGAMAGTVCGLLAQQIGAAATLWILPFTAGGFIYIATVSVMPELLQDVKVGQSAKEIVGLLVGVAMMVLIAKFE